MPSQPRSSVAIATSENFQLHVHGDEFPMGGNFSKPFDIHGMSAVAETDPLHSLEADAIAEHTPHALRPITPADMSS